MDEPLDAFRSEVRAFLHRALPAELAARVRAGHTLSRDELMGWHRALHRQGWVAMHWPVAHGGPGWSIAQKYVFEEECARAGAPGLIPMGLTIIGPLLIAYGSPEQQARFLPRIRDGSDIWCQGWSEPDAGSDLASLRCRARRDGDHYVVTGTKIWTTHAQWADWCMVLVRTATTARRQDGITILLVDMRLPGITIRPLPSLDGMHVLNELHFDEVRVPVAQRVGEEDRGWALLKATVGHERILNADVGRCRAMLDRLATIARREKRGGKAVIDHPAFRHRMARAEIRLLALETLVLRALSAPDPANGPDAPLIKIRGTELQQELAWLLSDAAGPYGLPYHRTVLTDGWTEAPIGPPDVATLTPFHLFWRKASISAGTNEIMRNMIARRLLDEPGTSGEADAEQRAIRDGVQRYLAQECDILDRLRDPSRAADGAARRWQDFARLGWLGLPLPEAHGGSGGGMAELWPLLTALGHGLALDPYLPTVVLGGLAIARWGSEAQRARLLPLIAAGRLRVALASMEGCPGGDADTTRARRTQDGWRVDGHKGVALGAPEAELLILGSHGASAETGPVLLLIDPAAPGVTLRPYPLVDGRIAAELHLHDVAPEAVLAEGEDAVAALEDAVLAGALACAAEATGAMEAALERTIAHLRQRQQFGARLADQQALRHRVADMFIACQESAALGWRAALAFDEPRTGLRRMAIAAAIAQAGPASLRVCEEAIQLHGAIAITDEFPVGHYLKRAIVAERIFGGADHWLDTFCAASASGGPAPG